MIATPTNTKKSGFIIFNNIVSTLVSPPLSLIQLKALEQVCIH